MDAAHRNACLGWWLCNVRLSIYLALPCNDMHVHNRVGGSKRGKVRHNAPQAALFLVLVIRFLAQGSQHSVVVAVLDRQAQLTAAHALSRLVTRPVLD